MEPNQFSSSKILKHIDRIDEWQKKGVSRPITYELDMTNVCNSKCHFCFGFFDQKKYQVSINLNVFVICNVGFLGSKICHL